MAFKKKTKVEESEIQEETKSLGSLLDEEEEGQLVIDVFENPGEFVIKSAVAGIKPEDLDIAVEEDMVTIRGRRERDEEVPEENYLYRECFWGAFSRTVILPGAIDVDRAQASLKNGILTIRLPKSEETQEKKIDISEDES